MTTTVDRPTDPDPDPQPGARRRGRGRLGQVLIGVLVTVATVAAGVATAFFVLPRFLAPTPYYGTTFPNSQPAPALEGLRTDAGAPADLAADRGKVVLLFFGYLSCPDVCPTTLGTISQAVRQLGDDAERVHVYFVSVDPARDTPADLRSYLDNFDPAFTGLTGDRQALDRVTSAYGVYYQLGQPDAHGDYEVDHTASVTGVDAKGKLKILWNPKTTPDQLAADIRNLL